MCLDELLSGAFVCRHKAGSWNAVSADQFVEQTTIKIVKGDLKGITLSSTQVAEWIDSAYVSDTLDYCYSSTETPHKEKGVKRYKVDEDDRKRTSTEFLNCSHPLDNKSGVLYNIHNGQVILTMANVSDSLAFGWMMETPFRNSLPNGLHAKFSSPVNTMEHLERGVSISDKFVFDLESIFLHLLVVGQQREMELLPICVY